MALPARPGRAVLRDRNATRSAALLWLACALAAVSACSSHDSPDNAPKSSPPPSASQTSAPQDPAQKAKSEAVGAYKSYWLEMQKLYADSMGKGGNLKQYAASAALANAVADAKSTHDRNLIHTGEVAVGNPTVTKLDIKRKIPNATLSSCLDISRWQVVNTATKKPASLPSSRLTKFVVVSTIERWPEGWKVIRDEPQGKAC